MQIVDSHSFFRAPLIRTSVRSRALSCAEMQSGKAGSAWPDLIPLPAIRRQRDGRMENKVADGAIGMRPSAILRRPSIFKFSSLAKRAGGRRVFLSRRKITHCPLSVVPRPSSTSRLPPCCHRSSCSLLLVHHR